MPANTDEQLDALIDKHTVALTKRTEILPVGADPELGHGGEDPIVIRSFDTRVVNTYELSKDVLTLIRTAQVELLNRLLKKEEALGRWSSDKQLYEREVGVLSELINQELKQLEDKGSTG